MMLHKTSGHEAAGGSHDDKPAAMDVTTIAGLNQTLE